MKFVSPSQFADPDAAARKLVEIANACEAVQDGRIYIELINAPFLEGGWYVRCEVHASGCRAVRVMVAKGWQRPLDDPIALTRGRQLVTLLEAGPGYSNDLQRQ